MPELEAPDGHREPTRGFRRSSTLCVGYTHLLLGMALTLGPDRWTSSPNFAVASSILPMRVWAVAMIISGAFLLARQQIPGHAIALVALLYLGLCTAATLFTIADSGTGPIYILGWAVLNGIGLYSRAVEYGRTKQ